MSSYHWCCCTHTNNDLQLHLIVVARDRRAFANKYILCVPQFDLADLEHRYRDVQVGDCDAVLLTTGMKRLEASYACGHKLQQKQTKISNIMV